MYSSYGVHFIGPLDCGSALSHAHPRISLPARAKHLPSHRYTVQATSVCGPSVSCDPPMKSRCPSRFWEDSHLADLSTDVIEPGSISVSDPGQRLSDNEARHADHARTTAGVLAAGSSSSYIEMATKHDTSLIGYVHKRVSKDEPFRQITWESVRTDRRRTCTLVFPPDKRSPSPVHLPVFRIRLPPRLVISQIGAMFIPPRKTASVLEP
jgi:hypothetical protein